MHERPLTSLAQVLLLFFVLTFAVHVESPVASVVDTPHNETNAITCGTCHSYSIWWRYSPVFTTSDYPTVADSVCNQCHGSAGPAFVKAGHSTASMGGAPHPVAGTWSTKCVDCHDPHLQQQVRWLPSSPLFNDGSMAGGLFLVEGKMTAITDNLDGTTTFHFDNGLAKPGWGDSAHWTMKSGHDGRGLILALGYGKAEHTYEVVAASTPAALPSVLPASGEGTITVQTGSAALPTEYENTPFGLFYGQLIKNLIKTPNSGSRSVKFFDGKDGLVTTSATPRDGVCQVCHTVTKYWRNNGDTAPNTWEQHNPTITCTSCHYSESGFKPSGGPHTFLGDTPICKVCHTSGDMLAIHNNNCQHCHTTPPALADPANKPLVSAILRGTCQDCHGVKAHPSATAHNHRQKTASCEDCHTVANAAAVDALHQNDCTTCHGYAGVKLSPGTVANAITTGMSGTDVDCQTCHVDDHVAITDITAMDYFINPSVNMACGTCHVPAYGGPAHNNLQTVTTCSSCHFFISLDEGGNPVGTPGDFNSIWSVHKQDCFTCHLSSRPEVQDAITIGRLVPGAPINCTTCHGAVKHTDSVADHDKRLKVDSCASCHAVDTAMAVDALHKSSCTTCHAYAGTKLDPATVANAISAGANGEAVDCRTCHTYNGHHDTPEAANNDCTITCHAAVDHSLTVAASATCAASSCHPGTAGTMNGVPLALAEATIHDACRTCHAFDANKRGVLLDFTNNKGVVGSGRIPAGGVCTSCHTMPVISAYHHASPRTEAGQCETCHVDPRPTWGPSSPGDNGTASGLAQARPTQMACLKCHVLFTGANMTVTKFERSDYNSYRQDWIRSTVHSIPMSGTRINNYGICLSCHFKGSTKVPESAWVSLWHAHPSRFGGAAWTFYNQDYDQYNGKLFKRGSGSDELATSGDSAHFVPGRSKRLETDSAPQSGISGFNLFAPNYGRPEHNSAIINDVDYSSGGTGMDYYSFVSPAYDTPAFTRIAVPAAMQLGDPASATLDATSRAVPVFASLAPMDNPPPATDWVKVKSAIFVSSISSVTVVASTSSDCANLKTVYGGTVFVMAGTPSDCTAVISTPTAPVSGATVDVTTINTLGLNVLGYRIATPNPGAIAFSASTYSVAENVSGGKAAITVSRTGGSTGTVSVSYATSDGTATAGLGNDYTATSGTLTWLEGETDKTFEIDILADTTPEANETVTLLLSNPSGGATLGMPNTARLTIADDDFVAGTIALAAPTYTVNEGAGTVTITVNRTDSFSGEVSVDYMTNPFGSTAKAGRNYTATAGTLIWGNGETGSRTFDIPILVDQTAAQTTTLNLAINNPTGGARLGAQKTAVLTITTPDVVTVLDDWPAIPQISQSDSGIFNIGSGANRLLLVAVSCANWSVAATGQTFSATYGGKPLTQATSQNSSRYHQTWIGYLTEADIASRAGNTVIVTVNGTHTAVIAFVASYQNVNQTRPIAASGGNDWPALQSSTTVSATPLLVGPGGYALYNWSSLYTGHRVWDNESYATIAEYEQSSIRGGVAARRFLTAASTNPTINWHYEWNDLNGASSGITLNSSGGPVAVAMASSTYSAEETAGGGGAFITVSRLGSAAGALGVHYATSDGTATAGADYTATAGELIWDALDMADKTIMIPIIDDTAVEAIETVSLALSNPTGGAILGVSDTAVLNIADSATITLTASNYSVNENGGTATITASRTGLLSSGAVGVSYATTAGGTATAGADYIVTSGTLSWAAGDTADKTFQITINNDQLYTGDRNITLALAAPTGGAKLGSTTTAVLTIVDDETTGLAFTAANYSVMENAGTATITVCRSGLSSGAVSVQYYTPGTSGTLNWASGDMSDKTFTIPIVDDSLVDGSQWKDLVLTNPAGGASLGRQSTATLWISDDDTNIAFSLAAYSVNENGGTATITASRTGLSADAVSVGYATADGTAIAGSDYSATAGVLNWPAGDTANKTFQVTILDDATVEANETINLALSSPSGATLGSQNTAVLSIVDEDRNTISLTAATYYIYENGGAATITAHRTGLATGAVGVSYATSSVKTLSPATPGVDYLAASGTLSWAAGDMADKTFTVPILVDSVPENPENISLILSAPTGDVILGSINAAKLTIFDDDTNIYFSAATYSANEHDGTATISVSRYGCGFCEWGPMSVNYATIAGGTASAGSDYTATSGTVSWGAGETDDKVFTITLLNDSLLEGNETIHLELTAPTDGATLGPQNTAVLNIVDDE